MGMWFLGDCFLQSSVLEVMDSDVIEILKSIIKSLLIIAKFLPS